jgi:regulator of sirC expression with transglutaminase-like and TPR domain
VQERIIQLIHRVHFQDLQAELKQWASSENPELLRGAILVAKYQYPDLNVPFLLTQFDQMRRNLWLELNNYLTSIEKINIFNSILYNYYKLQGNELTLRNPDHFYINKLLESKQGNVYTIGILILSLAELLDVPIFAVAIPRQFLLAYFDSLQHFFVTDGSVTKQIGFYIDPLNGMIYTQNDVEHYLNKINLSFKRNSIFLPQSAQQIIFRMLEDLCQCFEYNKDEDRAIEVKQLMSIVNPSELDL